jgi:hypothetical protein
MAESASLDVLVEPWSTGHSFTFGEDHFTRPWFGPENEGVQHTYKHPSLVKPPRYDTNHPTISLKNIFIEKGISLPVSISSLAAQFGLTPPFSARELVRVLR